MQVFIHGCCVFVLQLWGTHRDWGKLCLTVTELHRLQLVRWKLSFTSIIPAFIHRVTVLNIKDHRQVKKLISWVGSATTSQRAWLSSQKKSQTWIKDDPIFKHGASKTAELFCLLNSALHQKTPGVWFHPSIYSTYYISALMLNGPRNPIKFIIRVFSSLLLHLFIFLFAFLLFSR